MNMRSLQRGFTLIELVVTFAVVAILLLMAAPNFIAIQRGAELTSVANTFLGSLTAARSEAMKRQQSTFVMPIVANDWSQGWVVFVDVDGNLSQGAADVELSRQSPMPATVSVDINVDSAGFNDATKSLQYVMFNGAGFMRYMDGTFKAGSIDLKSVTGTKRRVIAEPAGRLRVCNPDTDPGCKDTTL